MREKESALRAELDAAVLDRQLAVSALQQNEAAIDMAKVLKVAETIGVEQCHVDQDQSPDPIQSIGQSIAHLNSL